MHQHCQGDTRCGYVTALPFGENLPVVGFGPVSSRDLEPR